MKKDELKNNSLSQSKKRYLFIAFAVLLLAIPIVFLFRKHSPSVASTSVAPVNITALERAAEETPSYSNLINLSVGYINIGKPGRSIPKLKQALAIKPQSAVAYNNLGVAYTMLKNFPLAIDACDKAIALDSTLTLAKNNLKWALEEQRKTFARINILEQTQQAEKDSTFYMQLGLSYYYIGNYEKSLAIYQEGLTKTPDNKVLLNNMGTTLIMMKRYDDAIAVFNRILNTDSSDQLARNNISWAKSEQTQDQMVIKK